MDINVNRIDISAKIKLYETAKKEKEVLNGGAAAGKTAAKAESYDKITISSEAKNLNLLDFAKAKVKYELDRDLSDTKNTEKINALREKIKNGEYAVSSRDIAAALISGGSGA